MIDDVDCRYRVFGKPIRKATFQGESPSFSLRCVACMQSIFPADSPITVPSGASACVCGLCGEEGCACTKMTCYERPYTRIIVFWALHFALRLVRIPDLRELSPFVLVRIDTPGSLDPCWLVVYVQPAFGQ